MGRCLSAYVLLEGSELAEGILSSGLVSGEVGIVPADYRSKERYGKRLRLEGERYQTLVLAEKLLGGLESNS